MVICPNVLKLSMNTEAKAKTIAIGLWFTPSKSSAALNTPWIHTPNTINHTTTNEPFSSLGLVVSINASKNNADITLDKTDLFDIFIFTYHIKSRDNCRGYYLLIGAW